MAWTETTRDHYRRDALRYASDLTDPEWALVSPFRNCLYGGGRQSDQPAILVLLVNGLEFPV